MRDDRLLPSDDHAEKALICAFLLASDAPELRADLSAEVATADFLSPDNALLWREAVALWISGSALDAITLRDALSRKGMLEEIGGMGYLAAVLESCPSYSEWESYKRIVLDLSQRRDLIASATAAIDRAYEPGDRRGEEIISDHIDAAGKILQRDAGRKSQTVGELVDSVIDQIDHPADGRFLRLGYREFDEIYKGMLPGECIMVAGKPSMGKSTLARCFAKNLGMAGVPGGYFSLEESAEKVAQNLISALASVENKSLRRREVDLEEIARIRKSRETFAQMPMHITDRCRTWPQIRAEATRMIARYGIQYLVLDYLQLLTGFGKADGEEYSRVSAASMAVTQFCKEKRLVGILVVQPNRSNDKRDNKRLTMSDLRGSGQLEQDADAILMLHREDYYRVTDPTRSNEPLDQVSEVCVAKWRDSERGHVLKLKSELSYQRFVDFQEQIPEFSL